MRLPPVSGVVGVHAWTLAFGLDAASGRRCEPAGATDRESPR
jgi:hypothetical protein